MNLFKVLSALALTLWSPSLSFADTTQTCGDVPAICTIRKIEIRYGSMVQHCLIIRQGKNATEAACFLSPEEGTPTVTLDLAKKTGEIYQASGICNFIQ